MNEVPVNEPTVLVVHDEVEIRHPLRLTLEANGCRVVEVSTERRVLTEAAQHRRDTRHYAPIRKASSQCGPPYPL